MIKFLQNLFGGSRNERELKKIWPIVDEINEYVDQFKSISDDELKAKTIEFKERIQSAVGEIESDQEKIKNRLKGVAEQGEEVEVLAVADRHDLYAELDSLEDEWKNTIQHTLDEILPEAFAVIKETCRRLVGETWIAGGTEVEWNMIPYDVQMLGGVIMHRGNIAEMKTGEGKTLVAVAPVYLNALTGKGVHIVTVNPYLAQRDSEWMAPVYGFHGLTVGCIDKHKSHSAERREAYRADITFGTNNEFGFDYLRDNSFVVEPDQLVQREHNFAIIDEVDSVLIDEARTPLIISGPVPDSDVGQFEELKSSVEQLFKMQTRQVAQFVSEADTALKEKATAEAAGEKKKARGLDEIAGLALLRAHHGHPRSKRLLKLKNEPGMTRLLQSTENFYLQDSAKHMHIVDDEIFYALDEKQRAIEMSDKGREYIAKAAGKDNDFFVIPDVGAEVAQIEQDRKEEIKTLEDALNADSTLSEEKRANKRTNDLQKIDSDAEEKRRNLNTLYAERAERIHAVNQLLKAYALFEKDKEYIVQEGKIVIVDEQTGRAMIGRRYSDGLHQAIEAKEKVKIEASTQTYATVTLQNYFRLYGKLSGMTGTAETESAEFYEIYKLDVNIIPTNRPITRDDKDDLIFKTRREKFGAVIDKIQEYHESGQPVLVGTTSVDVSEQLSRLLKRRKIRHNVLNAKQDRAKDEALIVAEAGHPGAVTIATNMAGRGTDIKLSEEVLAGGGLAIIGTERHESRRIDLQLRGRAGRQGDAGESQFFVSLEDNLMRLFISDGTAKVMDRMGLNDGDIITHPMVTKGIERAQKKVEQNNFGIRKRQLEYDDVLNAQREVIYDRRMHALNGERLRGDFADMLFDVIEGIVQEFVGAEAYEDLIENLRMNLAFESKIAIDEMRSMRINSLVDALFDEAVEIYNKKRAHFADMFARSIADMANSDPESRPERLYVNYSDRRKVIRAVVRVDDAIATQGQEFNDALERTAVLSSIDGKWMEHLRELDTLKEAVGLRAYGQKDPLVEYKREAFTLFSAMLTEISQDVVSFVFKAGPLVEGSKQGSGKQRKGIDRNRARTSQSAGTSYGVKSAAGNANKSADRDPTANKKQPFVADKARKMKPNEPCYCDSGKKFKHCHGKQ